MCFTVPTGKTCVQFYYALIGAQVGNLAVMTQSRGQQKEIWRISGPSTPVGHEYVQWQSEHWWLEQLTIPVSVDSILFVATQGSGHLSDIAIDRIAFLDKCPPSSGK